MVGGVRVEICCSEIGEKTCGVGGVYLTHLGDVAKFPRPLVLLVRRAVATPHGSPHGRLLTSPVGRTAWCPHKAVLPSLAARLLLGRLVGNHLFRSRKIVCGPLPPDRHGNETPVLPSQAGRRLLCPGSLGRGSFCRWNPRWNPKRIRGLAVFD